MEQTRTEDLDQFENKLRDLLLEREKLYKKVQDFRVSSNQTESSVRGIRKVNTEIKSTQTKVNKIKKELGWSNAEIKSSEIKNKMRA